MNVFRVWVPHLKRVFRTQDVRIDESIRYDPKDLHIPQELRQLVEELIDTIETPKSILYDDAKYEPPKRDDLIVLDSSEIPKIESMTPVATSSVEKNQKNHTIDELPGQFSTPEMIPEPASKATATDNAFPDPGYQLNVELDHLFTIYLSSLNELPRSRPSQHLYLDQFMDACDIEITKIQERGTYIEATLSPGHHATLLMWVFDYKFDDNSYLLKHKTCLVVRGDLVPANGKRTHTDTLAVSTARVMFALMAYFDLDARHLDDVNVFLNSFLDEDKIIYYFFSDSCKQPGKVMKLLRTFYGLSRSPYLWFRELTETLKGLGFKFVLEDICLLTNGRIIMFFYVDDIVVLNHPEHHLKANKVILKLKAKYEICDLGDLQWFLNIRISRDHAHQCIYLTQQYGLSTGSSKKTEIKSFQALVGSLIYPAFMIRPDIAHTTSLLARFMQNPLPFYSAEADRVICFLRDSKDLSLVYDSSNSTNSLALFKAYSDAAYADDTITRLSSEGYLFSLFAGPVDWKATCQSTVTTLTTEAELLALSHTAKELYWWRHFFEQLDFDPGHKLEICCDNSMAASLVTKQ
ncbi:hypothetical protein VTO42DRAFT_3918 [Malbranchea cinnamomea]